MGSTELAVGALVVLLGGMVQGCTGFGNALVMAPVLMLLMPYQQVPPLVMLLALVNNGAVMIEARTAVSGRLVLPLMLGGVIALPLGAYLLKSLDASVFKLGLGVVVLLLAVALFAGLRLPLLPRWRNLLPVGMLSGLLGGSTSISGPPVILFLANLGISKQSFRANLVAHFALLNAVSLILYGVFGLLNRAVFVTAAIYLLPLLLGSALGIWIARRVHEQAFSRLVLVLIAAIGALLIVSNLGVLS